MKGTGLREPVAERLRIPVAYGTPTVLMDWAGVEDALRGALHYWLVTARPDGRPHAVPVDGLWLDGTLIVGGDPDTVHGRNLNANPAVTLHLEDTESATIVDGVAEWLKPPPRQARSLADASQAKYGFAPPVAAFAAGVWQLRPRVVMAWTDISRDATRFRFG